MLPIRTRVARSNDNEGVLCIPQSSSIIIRASPSDCLMSYQDTRKVGGSYSFAEILSMYSTTPVGWAVGES